MPEIIVKYKSAKALKALQDLAKMFDLAIEKPASNNLSYENQSLSGLPITFAKNPDVTALAGIWEARDLPLKTYVQKHNLLTPTKRKR